MSEKAANVRLELAASGFLTMLQQIEKGAKELSQQVEGIGAAGEKADRKLHPALQSMKKGLGAAKDSLVELGGQLKSTLATAATLGGALSVGAGVKGALDAVSAYKDLAFAISTGTGQAVKWEEVQRDVESVSNRWKRSTDEVRDSYRALFEQTGNLQFTADAVDAVAMAAAATGKPVSTLTEIAGTLNEKFGITGGEVQDAMASVVELGNKGGITIEGMGEKLGIVGASAKMLGMSGKAGLQQVLGMMNIADDATGSLKKSIAAVSGLMEGLASPDQQKAIQQTLGVKITTSKGELRKDALDSILAKTHGKQELLAKVFKGDELKLVSAFGKEFQKTFDETKGDSRTKLRAALATFHEALTKAGKSTLSAADLEKEAQSRLDSPRAHMQEAINKFQQAFEKPEMIAAVNKLARALPKFADLLARLVEFGTSHPLLAGAGFVGGKAAMSMGSSMAGDLISGLLKGKKKVGSEVGEEIAKSAGGSKAWGTVGGIVGVAIAAKIAYELGKAAIDKHFEGEANQQRDVVMGDVNASITAQQGTRSEKQAALASQRARLQALLNQQRDPSLMNALGDLGGGAAAKLGLVDKVKSSSEQHNEQIDKTVQSIRELEASLDKGAKGGGKAGDALDKTAQSAERAAAAFDRIATSFGGGGSGSNGLPPQPSNNSGSNPWQ